MNCVGGGYSGGYGSQGGYGDYSGGYGSQGGNLFPFFLSSFCPVFILYWRGKSFLFLRLGRNYAYLIFINIFKQDVVIYFSVCFIKYYLSFCVQIAVHTFFISFVFIWHVLLLLHSTIVFVFKLAGMTALDLTMVIAMVVVL